MSSVTAVLIIASIGVGVSLGQQKKKGIDSSKTAVVMAFDGNGVKAAGFPELSRTTVIQILRDEGMFAAVLTPEEAKDKDKATIIEINAKLVEFKAGNMATRVLVGLGSGRASAAYEFTFKDAASGKVVWQKTIKEKASVWSNSASSTAQRLELPEKIAKTLVKELKK